MVKVLVVDDDKIIRLYLKDLISKKFGCTVIEAGNGIEALKMVNGEHPDVILLDIGMPLMDGMEFLESLRKENNFEKVPVIIITAHSDKSTVNKFMELGIKDYILKPLGFYETYKRLREVISSYAENAEKEEVPWTIPEKADKLKKILVIDEDDDFRDFFRLMLKNKFSIIQGKTGADCLDLYLKHRPSMIFLSEGLSIVSEKEIARKIKLEREDSRTKIYLNRILASDQYNSSGLFDGILRKSYSMAVYGKEFARIVQKIDSDREIAENIIRNHLMEELDTSIKYAIKIKANEDVTIMKNHKIELKKGKILATLDLKDEVTGITLQVGIIGSEEDAVKIAKKMPDKPLFLYEGAYESLNLICLTITKRLQLALEKYGIPLSLSEEYGEKSIDQISDESWENFLYFKTAGGSRFAVITNLF